MLRFLLPLRLMMLCASLGALLGAAIMIWLAAVKLGHGAEVLWTIGSAAAGDITAAVMGATDAFLFGVVLIIFAYAIAFGFAFQPKGEESDRLPKWMHVEGIGELKHTLIGVVIVYLVVDFATDLATAESALTWQALIKPSSVVLIAAARRLMSGTHLLARE